MPADMGYPYLTLSKVGGYDENEMKTVSFNGY
jgi:hypothetical protein